MPQPFLQPIYLYKTHSTSELYKDTLVDNISFDQHCLSRSDANFLCKMDTKLINIWTKITYNEHISDEINTIQMHTFLVYPSFSCRNFYLKICKIKRKLGQS